MKKISKVLICILLVLTLVGCSSNIVGKWSTGSNLVSVSYEFKSDKTGTMLISGVGTSFTYETKGSEVTITYSLLGIVYSVTSTYEIKDNKLYLTTDGSTVELTKE